MPAAVARDQGKTSFIKQMLFEDPTANVKRINEAWKKSGRSDTISVSLINKQRSEAGLTRSRGTRSAVVEGKRPYTGKKRGRKPKSASTVAATTTSILDDASTTTFRGRNARLNRLVDVEADIDRLLFKVMALDGLTEVETTLRQARRLLYRAIG